MSRMLDTTVTPFTYYVLATMSLGDSRGVAMQYGPWVIDFARDVIALAGVPVALLSWDQARVLVADRPDALRWLRILREDCEHRASLPPLNGRA
jgi:hypothetical protein